MTLVRARLPAPAGKAPELVCAEVWGGNRPVNAFISLPGVRGKVFSHPCDGGRGGDIHYVSICGSGLLSRLCVADVAGHGQAVAAVSSEIHRLLRRYMSTLDQRRVLSELNERLERAALARMITCAAASYFPPLRLLSVSYAGHPPAWFFRTEQDRWQRLVSRPRKAGGRELLDLPLAVDRQVVFSRRQVRVKPGDRLLVLTDGVLEAPGPGGELYGEARLARLLAQHRHDEPAELVDRVVASVAEFTGDPSLPHDDVTLILVEFVRGPRAFGVWHAVKNRVVGLRRWRHRAE